MGLVYLLTPLDFHFRMLYSYSGHALYIFLRSPDSPDFPSDMPTLIL